MPAQQRGSSSSGRSLGDLMFSQEDLNHFSEAQLDAMGKSELGQHLEELLHSDWIQPKQVFTAAYEMDADPASQPASQPSELPAAPPQGNVELPGDVFGGVEPVEPEENDSSSESEEPAPMELEKETVQENGQESHEEPAPEPVPEEPGSGRRQQLLLSPSWRLGALAAMELKRRKQLEQAEDGAQVGVLLGQIRYSQDSIRGTFRDNRMLKQMRLELSSGSKSVGQIPMLRAVYRDGLIYSADNRRLWAFKHSMNSNTRIPVIKKRTDDQFLKKLTTVTSGITIARRGDLKQY
ncbi:unnamed protein product [Effrenium voratum]|nr:unnamed protein product [Effrenium voratum]